MIKPNEILKWVRRLIKIISYIFSSSLLLLHVSGRKSRSATSKAFPILVKDIESSLDELKRGSKKLITVDIPRPFITPWQEACHQQKGAQAKGRSQERIHATPDEVAEENWISYLPLIRP